MRARVALITGSTSGIGLGIAIEFAKAGYNIAFNGLESNGAEIAKEVGEKYSVKTVFSSANMLKPAEIAEMVTMAGTIGDITVLVNNAGIQHVAAIDEFPEEKWNNIIGINLNSSFHTSKLVWKGMKERGFGRIINIASAHGLVASEFKSAYVAAKHGVVGLTKVLALEGAPFGITANAICPGYVETPLVKNQIKDQAQTHGISEQEVVSKIMLHKQAVKQFVKVESIGALCVFLASEHGNLITGTALPIDGGWNAQ